MKSGPGHFRRWAGCVACAWGLAASAAACAAQPASSTDTFGTKPIRIVVGFTPGTTTDITARTLGLLLSDRIGQPVVIENREGVNSGIANGIVGRATPDGHTLLIGTLSLVLSPLLYKELPFDPASLAPVGLIVLAQNVISVNPKLGATNIKELIAIAREQPGKIRYGSSGRGSSAFLTMELLKSMAGVDIQEIPYKSTSQALTDLISGEIPIYPPSLVAAVPHIKSARIRPLGVTGPKRSPIMPELPAVAETVPGYDAATGIYGIMVPVATPKAVVTRLNREIVAVVSSAEFRTRMQAQGADVVGTTPEEYAARLDAERKKWTELFQKLGIGRQ